MDDLAGSYRVRLASAPGIDRLPTAWTARIMEALNRVMPLVYRGKSFDGARGSNEFVGGLKRAHFSLHEGGPEPRGLLIDYDIDANPSALRPMAAQVRLFEDRLIVCRLIWRGRGGQIRSLLYFTLSRA
ncbi:MAG: hypothetical protein K1X95_01020 [Acidimicrobiia bacterium]|nr:hypothetical protein [Acidimicrobiia bacterium]